MPSKPMTAQTDWPLCPVDTPNCLFALGGVSVKIIGGGTYYRRDGSAVVIPGERVMSTSTQCHTCGAVWTGTSRDGGPWEWKSRGCDPANATILREEKTPEAV